MFSGVKRATASEAAIAMELYVPFATILAIIFLGDRIGWRSGLGVALAFIGVAIIALGDAGETSTSASAGGRALGVGLVAAGAFAEAVGAILIKQTKGFKPLELLAWFSLVGAAGLWIMTAIFESGQGQAFKDSDQLLVIGAILYSAAGASLFGHTAYYWLLQRLPVSLVAPSALLTTVIAVAFGVALLKDPLGPQMIAGGLMVLAGVGVVILRRSSKQDIKTPITEAGAVS